MKAVILTNGKMENLEFYKRIAREGELIICADGAFKYAFEMGIKPHIALGDFDSISEELMDTLEASNIPLLKFPREKDKTDTELAVDYAMKKGATQITLLGATGSRLDHTMANITLMARTAEKGIKCRIVDEKNDCYFVTDKILLEKIGKRFVSIIPITKEIVVEKTEGLYYPLKNDTISFGSSWGISNYAVEPLVAISIKKGTAMVVIARE